MNFKAQKIDGRLDINWDRLALYVAKWKDGTWFDVEITRKQRKKSTPMRKYYFAEVIAKYADHLGYDKGEETLLLHRQLKIVFFQVQPDSKGIYRNVPHVFADESELPVSQKKEFLDWVVRKAAQDGCIVNDPK